MKDLLDSMFSLPKSELPAADGPAPQSIEEAEAILLQLAYSFRGTSQPLPTMAAAHTVHQPSIARNANPKIDLAAAINSIHSYKVAYEAIPEALLIVASDGTIVHVNSHVLTLFGYTSDELIGQLVEILVAERFREKHPDQRQSYFNEPHIRPMGLNLDLFGRHRNGYDIPVEISLAPLHTEAGVMAVATIRDLSNQRRIQEQIKRFEARYRTLVEGLPAVTFMAALDNEANELYVSPQIESLLGFSQQEWLSNPILWYTQLHPDDRKRWHTEFAQTCSTGTKFNSIYRFYSRDGRVVWVHGEAKVVRDDKGRPIYLQGTAFDITQLKLAEEQLKQLNQTLESRVEERTAELSATNQTLQNEVRERKKAEDEIRRINEDLAVAHEQAVAANLTKSQFLANMSHELRTPLNAIIGYSELLQLIAAEKDDASLHADLDKIKRSGTHLLAIINDILDISKIEAGKLQVEQQPFRVPDILNEIRESGLQLAQRNRNRFRIDIDNDVWPVFADFVRLKQCLLNLISNACKFTENGTIVLAIRNDIDDDHDWVVFVIRDTGIGISPEQMARLFQPFTQVDASTTRRFEGTGLGLAITKKLCEAMGGSITLESEIRMGSTFTIRMPRYVKSILSAN